MVDGPVAAVRALVVDESSIWAPVRTGDSVGTDKRDGERHHGERKTELEGHL